RGRSRGRRCARAPLAFRAKSRNLPRKRAAARFFFNSPPAHGPMAEKDLTQGPVPGLVVKLALPVFAAFVLQSMFSLADLYFVGRLGPTPQAALGIGLNTFMILLALGQTVGIGALALMSQAYGAGQRSRVTRVFAHSLLLVAVIGTVFWIGGFFAAEYYFALFSGDGAVQKEGVAFFRVYAATFLFQLFLMVAGYGWRAVGDFITPTALMVAGVLLNLALDPLLIFGPGPLPALGLAGAAWATVISQVLVAAVYLWLIFGRGGGRLLSLRPAGLPRIDWALVGRMLRIGIPSGLQFIVFAAIVLAGYRFLRPFGAEAIAAVTIGSRLVHAVLMPAIAIGAAVASIVGQSFGGGKFGRVRQAVGWGSLYAAALLLAVYAAFRADAGFWVGLFAGEPAIVAIGAQYLLILGWVLPVEAITWVVIFALQGLGRTLPPLAAVSVRFPFYLATLWTLEFAGRLTLPAMFWSAALTLFLQTAIVVAFLAHLWRGVLGGAPGVDGASAGPDGARQGHGAAAGALQMND
ncbi:MAG: MATE family efflux transporter, partial [bacterium]